MATELDLSSSIFEENEINQIIQEVSDTFAQDALIYDQMVLNNFIKQLQWCYDILSVNVKGPQAAKAAAKGYYYIQSFRNWLLKQTLDYRYYLTDKDGDVTKATVYTFNEDTLLRRMNYQGGRLTLSTKIIHQAEHDITYQKLFDAHVQNLLNGLTDKWDGGKHAKYRVHKNILMHYYRKDYPYLGIIDEKTNRIKYRSFNKGNIYEAIDSAVTEYVQKPNLNIADLFYSKYLRHDNVIGFKGGDNSISNTSIKANTADIMKGVTVRKTLQQLIQVLQVPPLNSKQAKQAFTDIFMDTSIKNQTKTALNRGAVSRINKLLKNLTPK